MAYTIPDFGPSDLLNSAVEGERRVKIEIDQRLVAQGNNLDRLYVQNLNYRDDVVAQGITFYIDYAQTSIASGTKTYATITTPSDKYVALIDREVLTDKERLFFKSYSSYTGGTIGAAIPIGNLRTDSPFSTGVTANVLSTPTTIDQTSLISNVPVFGALGNGNRASGGISADALFRLIAPNTTLLFEWENLSADAIYCKTMLAWFELPESAIIT